MINHYHRLEDYSKEGNLGTESRSIGAIGVWGLRVGEWKLWLDEAMCLLREECDARVEVKGV